MTAAELDRDATDLAHLLQCLIEGGGDLGGQFGRVGVLRFGIEGDVHQIVRHFLVDLGAQGDLVVARLGGQQAGAGQAGGGEGEGGGDTGHGAHGAVPFSMAFWPFSVKVA